MENMQRMIFFAEGEKTRLTCMLNPESILMRRKAGVRQLESLGGYSTGTRMQDAPLLYTNGGYTELTLDLLFDVTLPGHAMNIRNDNSNNADDVTSITSLLWDMSKNILDDEAKKSMKICRVLWGVAFDYTGIITTISERLEYFTPEGFARRSWIRLAIRHVAVDDLEPIDPYKAQVPKKHESIPDNVQMISEGASPSRVGELVESGESLLRVDKLAQDSHGSDRQWRTMAADYGIINPMQPVA